MSSEARNIYVAVTGSIAAYKTCDLIRSLTKQQYPVRVLMSANAERFIGPVTFQALSGNPVIRNDWDLGMLHIDIKNDCLLFVVVPATANIIGKFANGIADDIVSSSYLALDCPVLVAPAMNPFMYSSRPVQRNLARLKEDGVDLIDSVDGEVICGDEGRGKMAPLATIEKRIIERYGRIVEPERFV